MKTNFSVAVAYEDEGCDSLSTGVPSQSLYSSERDSPFLSRFSETCDTEGVSSESKKIRKKRNAYQKIDDDIRLQLLEAVQRNGETLKSASKRLDINYSSAKSILHTYRKEGRILKKNVFERTVKVCQYPFTEMDISPANGTPQIFGEVFTLKPLNFPEGFNAMEIYQESTSSSNETKSSTPIHRLTNNFDYLLVGAQQKVEDHSMVNSYYPNLEFKTSMKIEDNASYSTETDSNGPTIPSFGLVDNQSFTNPPGVLKSLDNFYMNYSNSPLSGGRANMFKDCSDSSSRRRFPKEFDSFSDMVNAIQNQPRNIDEGIHRSKNFGFSPAKLFNNKIEAKLMKEDGMAWNETIENVAIDTFKSFVDAQCLYRDALQKASVFSTLMQYQRLSPTNNWM